MFELLSGYPGGAKVHDALTGLRKHLHDAFSTSNGALLQDLDSLRLGPDEPWAVNAQRVMVTRSGSKLLILPPPSAGEPTGVDVRGHRPDTTRLLLSSCPP